MIGIPTIRYSDILFDVKNNQRALGDTESISKVVDPELNVLYTQEATYFRLTSDRFHNDDSLFRYNELLARC